MKKLIIGPKNHAEKALSSYGCDHIISIQDVADAELVPTPEGVKTHKHFLFDDLTDEVPIRYSSRDPEIIRSAAPTPEHVKAMLEHFRTLPDDANIYLHCFAGISRSTATAFMFYSDQLLEGNEWGAMLLTAHSALANGIWPNARIVTYADDLLGRNGKMLEALFTWQDMEKQDAQAMDAWIRGLNDKEKHKTMQTVTNGELWERQQYDLRIDKDKNPE